MEYSMHNISWKDLLPKLSKSHLFQGAKSSLSPSKRTRWSEYSVDEIRIQSIDSWYMKNQTIWMKFPNSHWKVEKLELKTKYKRDAPPWHLYQTPRVEHWDQDTVASPPASWHYSSVFPTPAHVENAFPREHFPRKWGKSTAWVIRLSPVRICPWGHYRAIRSTYAFLITVTGTICSSI